MGDILLRFETREDAFAYLSESRRLATSLLWDVRVEPGDGGWTVRVPFETYSADMADSLDRFRGVVVSTPV